MRAVLNKVVSVCAPVALVIASGQVFADAPPPPAPVPVSEPGAFALLVLAMGAMALVRRRK